MSSELEALRKENEELKKKLQALITAKKEGVELQRNYTPYSGYPIKPHKEPGKMNIVEFDIWKIKNLVASYKDILDSKVMKDPRIAFEGFRRWLRKLSADHKILQTSSPMDAKKYDLFVIKMNEWLGKIQRKVVGFDSKENEEYFKLVEAIDLTAPEKFKLDNGKKKK